MLKSEHEYFAVRLLFLKSRGVRAQEAGAVAPMSGQPFVASLLRPAWIDFSKTALGHEDV